MFKGEDLFSDFEVKRKAQLNDAEHFFFIFIAQNLQFLNFFQNQKFSISKKKKQILRHAPLNPLLPPREGC